MFPSVSQNNLRYSTNATPPYQDKSLTNYLLTHEMTKNVIRPFDGTSFQFWSWIEQIRSRIKDLPLSPLEILHILQSNSTGSPNKMIQDYISSSGIIDDNVLQEVWSALVDRYGSQTRISEEILERLSKFPLIKGQNIGKQLQDLHDLCKIACFNMQRSPELQILNISSGLKIVRGKLPRFVQDRWRKSGQHYEDYNSGMHPPFTYFIKFLNDLSKELCNKHYEDIALTPQEHRQFKTMHTQEIKQEMSSDDSCPIHNVPSHSLQQCKSFLKMPFEEKKKKVFELKLCFLCFGKHFRKDCTAVIKCERCSGVHNTAMHIDKQPKKIQDSTSGSGETTVSQSLCSTICGTSNSSINCSKTLLVHIAHKNNPSQMLKCYLILDDQSNCTLIDDKLVKFLNPQYYNHEYVLKTANGLETVTGGKMVSGLMVKGVRSTSWTSLPDALTNSCIPDTKMEVATPKMVRAHSKIAQYAHNFEEYDDSAEVLVLVGRNCGELMGTKCYGSGEPWVFKTLLGWALVGNTCLTGKTAAKHTLKTIRMMDQPFIVKNQIKPPTCELKSDIFQEFPDDEQPGISVNDSEFLNILSSNVTTTKEGNIQVPLPLKNADHLPDNRLAIFNRTQKTLTRLKSKPDMLQDCLNSMQKSIKAQHIEQVEEKETLPPAGKAWWLPVFPVVHPKKKKVRLVYDASAKYDGVCLNQHILQGPDFNNELRGVVHRFREEKIGVICDIESMFNSFIVPPSDRDYLRFFWFKNNDPNNNVIQYRGKTHMFGLTSSPAVANFCLKYTTTDNVASSCPSAQKFIEQNFYVDDGLAAVSTPNEAIKLITDARNILGNYNINLHKILSNSQEVLDAFLPSQIAEDCHILSCDDSISHRTLGILWNPREDVFIVEVDVPEKPFTKRGVLSVINSLYDPLGIASPVSLAGRLLQRQVLPSKKNINTELMNLGWDDELPSQYLESWNCWKKSLSSLNALKIPRSYIPPTFNSPNRELFVFSDASNSAIGYVIYMRSTHDNDVHVSFVTASSKVSPQSATSIPRMELCAAASAVQCASQITAELTLKPEKIHYFTDSTIVLGYINNTSKKFSRYITRRIEIIHKSSSSSDWHYINTKDNPADLASRPQHPDDLMKSRWLEGPEFLWQLDSPSWASPSPPLLPEQQIEKKIMKTSVSDSSVISEISHRCSTYKKVINVLKIVFKMKHHLDVTRQRLGHSLAPRKPEPSSHDCETYAIFCAQSDSYSNERLMIVNNKLPENHKISCLSPFIDDKGLIHVGGRLKNLYVPSDVKHPLLLDNKHPLTHLIIQHCHSSVAHQGKHLTIGEIRRSGYHIVGMKSVVKNFISKCIVCKKLRGSTSTQIMADLPKDRIEEVPPFSNTGLDLFGPFIVKDKKCTRRTKGEQKVWVVIFVCLVSRAVHVELITSLDTNAFRNSLQRFISIRGTPKLIRSDNGTNIVSTHSQMNDISFDSIKSKLEQQNINWLFNPPYASHFGGCYERKIGSIRRVFEGCLEQTGLRKLSYDEFHTLICESCAIVNNTPLYEVSIDPNDPFPITPASLMTLRESPNPPSLDNFTQADMLSYGLKRWRRVQYLSDQFWTRWRSHVVLELHKRHKWKTSKNCISIDDIVLVKDKNCKRNQWPLARVKDVKRSSDNLVRSVVLTFPPLNNSSKERNLIRCIHDLVLLIPSDNHKNNCSC